MPSYSAFGTCVQSEWALADLDEIEGPPGVVARRGEVRHARLRLNGARRAGHAEEGNLYLAWRDVGAFLMREGREVVVEPDPRVGEGVIPLFVQGAALALVLQQQGRCVLHAGAVGMGSRGVILAGGKGWGKSTLILALIGRGHRLIADDLAMIDLEGAGAPSVAAGPPAIKIWPASLEALGLNPARYPRLHPGIEKRVFRPAGVCASGFSPMTDLVILESGERCALEPLAPAESFARILPHWYAARYGAGFVEALGLRTHFEQCARLAASLRTWRLTRPARFDGLPRTIELMEDAFGAAE